MTLTIVDTGPLVAFLNRRDGYHFWTRARLQSIAPPMHTCEAVITEVLHLLRYIPKGHQQLWEMIRRQALTLSFELRDNSARVAKLMQRYADTPMSFADACLVCMSEDAPNSHVLTLDSNFRIYKRHGRRAIPSIRPD